MPATSADDSGLGATRHFGWSNMFVSPEDDPRADGGFQGERATLVGFLRDQRLTLDLKCSGLDAADLARRAVATSNLSLLGLVRHMAGVEQSWFRLRMAGDDAPRHYRSDSDRDADFNGAVADPAVVADAWGTWRAEIAFAEQYVALAPDLDVVGKRGDARFRGIARRLAADCGGARRERVHVFLDALVLGLALAAGAMPHLGGLGEVDHGSAALGQPLPTLRGKRMHA